MPICWICQFSSYFAIRYVVHVSTLCSTRISKVQCNVTTMCKGSNLTLILSCDLATKTL